MGRKERKGRRRTRAVRAELGLDELRRGLHHHRGWRVGAAEGLVRHLHEEVPPILGERETVSLRERPLASCLAVERSGDPRKWQKGAPPKRAPFYGLASDLSESSDKGSLALVDTRATPAILRLKLRAVALGLRAIRLARLLGKDEVHGGCSEKGSGQLVARAPQSKSIGPTKRFRPHRPSEPESFLNKKT